MEENKTSNNWNQKLHHAISQNKWKDIETYIDNGADINHPITKEKNAIVHCLTPLEWAIHYNCLRGLKILIQRGASLNVESSETPLIQSLRKNRLEVAKFLINIGANVCQPDESGKTPLSWATSLGNLNIIKLLLDHGAQFGISTSLIEAVETNNLEIVQHLLKRGALVNCRDKDGSTPLTKCIQVNNLDMRILNELLDNSADVNLVTNLGTPLILAVDHGKPELVPIFIQKGADVNHFDQIGWTPLMKAASSNKLDLVKELLDNGADVNLLTTIGTALLKCIERECLECLKLILENGADVNQPDKNDLYPIMSAIGKRNLEMVKLLVENGAFLTISDPSGDSPLLRAVAEGNFSIIDYIVQQKGIDLNHKNERHETALSKALSNCDFRTLDLLIKAGADQNLAAEEIGKAAAEDSNLASHFTDLKVVKGLIGSRRSSPSPGKT